MCENHICKFCVHSKPLGLTGRMLCKQKAIVSQTYTCKNFKMDLFRIKAKRMRTLPVSKFSSEDFSID